MSEMVRDRTKKLSEYKGHFVPAGAGEKDCPCLPCFSVHDCGYLDSAGRKIHRWHCVTNYNSGCPPRLRRPFYILKNTKRFQNRKRGDEFRCLRCGQKVIMGEIDFMAQEEER